jgi:hypothetical protein
MIFGHTARVAARLAIEKKMAVRDIGAAAYSDASQPGHRELVVEPKIQPIFSLYLVLTTTIHHMQKL